MNKEKIYILDLKLDRPYEKRTKNDRKLFEIPVVLYREWVYPARQNSKYHPCIYFNVSTVHKFKIGHSLPYFDMYISLARQVRNIRKLNVLLCLLGTDHIANSWVKVPLIKINRKIDDKCTFRWRKCTTLRILFLSILIYI